MIQRNEDGTTSALMECPRCENYDWHSRAHAGDDQHFRCGNCHATFTYAP